MDSNYSQWNENSTLEEIEILFLTQSLTGDAPSVAQLIALYPHWAGEITLLALDFEEQETARARQTPMAEMPEELRARLEERLQNSREPVDNLNQARKALKWTPDELASKLNLPTPIVVNLSRGLIRQWPSLLEFKLSAVLLRPIDQISAILRDSVATPAANFSAQGSVGASQAEPQSFRDALEECKRAKQLTPDQQSEWLGDE